MIRRVRSSSAMLAGAAMGLLAPALHAAPACDLPARLATPRPEGPSQREAKRVLPIGSYTLSLIWLPQTCRAASEGFGCREAAHTGFVLHGLWPDGKGKDWPQWCKPARTLPPATIRANYCTTPNAQLIQHEWAKHGTCMDGYTPDRYFNQSRQLFARIVQPDLRALSYRRLTARDIQRAIAAANPGLTADMMRLNVSRDGWLQEVWLCLDTRFKFRPCPVHQGGARADERVRIWRGGRDREEAAGGRQPSRRKVA